MFLAAGAANAKDIREYDPLFSAHDTLKIEVEGPFAFLARERPDEEEAEGKVRFVNTDGETLDFDVQIRARGNWRRNPEICDFPPLRINFKKSQTDDTLFHKQDKIKLVTHCNNTNRYAQAVISEYLAYRIYNALTDYSFRVRLVDITYVYTDREKSTNSYAVLIEHKERLGKRIDGDPVETERVPVSSIYPQNLNLASVFQYFRLRPHPTRSVATTRRCSRARKARIGRFRSTSTRPVSSTPSTRRPTRASALRPSRCGSIAAAAPTTSCCRRRCSTFAISARRSKR